MRYLQEASMSLNNVPPKVEVMGWNPQSLAEYMKRLKWSGCDTVVLKGSITGAQFLQMTECELLGFPSLYIAIITKIQHEINKGEQKRASGHKFKAQKHPKQEFVQDPELWDSDEFDNDTDQDYEGLRRAEQQDTDESSEGEYEVKSHQWPRVSKRQDGPYRGDPVHAPSPPERPSKPPLPHPPRMNHSLQRAFRAPEGSAVKAPGSSTSNIPQPRIPRPPTDVSNRAGKPTPAPRVQTQPAMVNNLVPRPRKDLDPSWYGGKVTRHQAEVALKEVDKDGAFVVRDSSQSSIEHPYTLMVLKQGKVYNIKIRNQGNSYSLGTGLSNKKFPGVKEMIAHHTHTPLLLIDAADRSPEAPSRCCLLHPAGL